MILYTLHNNGYIDFVEKTKLFPNEKFNMYLNLTNRCNCSCTFCLRPLKEDHSLWFTDGEPSIEEIKTAFTKIPMDCVEELVVCGFGEPTMRLDDLVTILKWVREYYPSLRIRLNTNGLSDLQYKKPTAHLFKGLLDVISISLNEISAEKYLEITRNVFGLEAYEAMLNFAESCKKYVPTVILTVVDVLGEEALKRSREICDERGITLRIRHFES